MTDNPISGAGSSPSLLEREEIIALETREEARLQKSLADIAESKAQTEREWEEKKLQAEEKAKQEANEDLKAFKETELRKILIEEETHAEAEANHIDTEGRKRIPRSVETLMNMFTNLTF